MASTTEESYEVKAIKLHISTIKSQISITTNNVSSAKSNMDAAIAMYASLQSQLDVSKKELKDVEKLLAEAEQRANIDNNVNDNVEGGSNKRRKVSPPPQDDDTNTAGVTVKMEDDGNAYDKETDNEEDSDDTNNDHAGGINVKKEEGNNHAYDDETDKEEEDDVAVSQSTSSNNVNQVIVEGSGDSLVNGTYTEEVGQVHKGAPLYSQGNHVIYRDSRSMGTYNWFIGYWYGSVSTIHAHNIQYCSPNNADSMTPPTNGWVALELGDNPAPKLRLVAANNDTNSEDAQEVSGRNGSRLEQALEETGGSIGPDTSEAASHSRGKPAEVRYNQAQEHAKIIIQGIPGIIGPPQGGNPPSEELRSCCNKVLANYRAGQRLVPKEISRAWGDLRNRVKKLVNVPLSDLLLLAILCSYFELPYHRRWEVIQGKFPMIYNEQE